MSIKKLLIANRGEISIRIARTCKRLGIQTVGIFSEQDKHSLHLSFCDEVYSLGGGSIVETYLNIQKIIEILKNSQAHALHPGYGFLSERAAFAQAVLDVGALWIGPLPNTIAKMGDKLQSRETMQKLGVPILPSSEGALSDVEEAKKYALKIGYPVMLKASAGGGGKGMRIVNTSQELSRALESAAKEAKNYFGDGSLYLEKYLENPHHVEVQVLGDGKGGGGHVFERECSIQRRHQKLLEESPAPWGSKFPQAKQKLLEVANQVVKKLPYANAGTLEFLGDEQGGFYFLEMNTRLQVEHPVTEWVTGLDLVEYQIRVSQGESLSKDPLVFAPNGHAIEVRIYAESPFEFLPTAGNVFDLCLPQGPFVRVDSALYPQYKIPMEYDPTLLKLSVWGQNREQAISRLRGALSELRILGVQSNQALFWAMTKEKDFNLGNYSTSYLPLHKEELKKIYQKEWEKILPLLSQIVIENSQSQTFVSKNNTSDSIWEKTSLQTPLKGEF